MAKLHLVEKMVKDIKYLLMPDESFEQDKAPLYLWDDKVGSVDFGKQYGTGDTS